MFACFVQTARQLLSVAIISLFAINRLHAELTGPALRFDYGQGRPLDNPLSSFMYFVPLIAPEQVSVFTNAGNTQIARVVSFHCHTNGAEFHAVCDFDFDGDGLQRSVFDHAFTFRRREKEWLAGKPLAHQIAEITVHGAGSGNVEIDGTLTNGQPAIVEMRLRFNSRGHPSPVSVSLEDIVLRNGEICSENEMVARVNMLTFRQKTPPKMEVTLASVKKKDAANSLWQNFVGGIKGGGQPAAPSAEHHRRRAANDDGFWNGAGLAETDVHVSVCHALERRSCKRAVIRQ